MSLKEITDKIRYYEELLNKQQSNLSIRMINDILDQIDLYEYYRDLKLKQVKEK